MLSHKTSISGLTYASPFTGFVNLINHFISDNDITVDTNLNIYSNFVCTKAIATFSLEQINYMISCLFHAIVCWTQKLVQREFHYCAICVQTSCNSICSWLLLFAFCTNCICHPVYNLISQFSYQLRVKSFKKWIKYFVLFAVKKLQMVSTLAHLFKQISDGLE